MSLLNLREYTVGQLTPDRIDRVLRKIENHVNGLAQRIGSQYSRQVNDNPNTPSTAQNLQSTLPPVSSAVITFATPSWMIILTAFQDVSPSSAAQLSQQSSTVGNNQVRTPLFHQIQVSTQQNFSSILVDFGKGYQHAISYPNANGSLWWRWRSSYDGLNFNGWSPSQTHS